MTSREKFESWWEQEKYDDKLNYITGIMFNRIKANMFRSWEAASREQEQKLTDQAVQLANAESKCRELAAMSVNLPKRSVGEVMHMSGFSRDYAEGWCAGNDNAIHEIRAAGIGVKGE